MVSRTVLLVAEPFPGLDAERVAGALARGLEGVQRELSADVMTAGGGARQLSTDVIAPGRLRASARERWTSGDAGERLRAARAVVIAAARLDERTLAGSVAFELATSARQAGVPAYAVTADDALDLFDARMLDLQVVLQAGTVRALSTAGRRLAVLV